MFRPSGEAVMLDYGLARHDQLPDLMQEEFRLPFGTAPYMSPEQLRGIRNDPRSDLFALGVLLYFFSTGERPFGETESSARHAPAAVARPGPAARACAPTVRPGCRRSCCAASRSSRPGATRPRRNSLSSSATRAKSS